MNFTHFLQRILDLVFTLNVIGWTLEMFRN
jgi:hypothetical protein